MIFYYQLNTKKNRTRKKIVRRNIQNDLNQLLKTILFLFLLLFRQKNKEVRRNIFIEDRNP